jgi:tetratricopeptide (TPR) repeat protein
MKKRLTRKFVASCVYWLFLIGFGFSTLYLTLTFFGTRDPKTLVLDSQGYIYVGDNSQQVRKFTGNGQLKTVFGEAKGWFDFTYLDHIAADGLGNVYTVIKGTQLKKYNSDGKFLLTWNAPVEIQSMVADSQGNLYVIYKYLKVVQKLDGRINLIKEWVLPEDLAQTSLSKLAITAQDELYVATDANGLISKYDPNGNLIERIKGVQNTYSGFAVGQNNFSYTYDLRGSVITKWDANGTLIASWGGIGDQPGQFSSKGSNYVYFGDIAAGANGYIYTVHAYDKQAIIQQYDSNGRFIKSWTDGFPETFSRFCLAIVFVILFFSVSVAHKIKNAIAPAEPLEAVALPQTVVATQTDNNLLEECIGALILPTPEVKNGKRLSETQLKQKMEAEIAQRVKIYFGQVLSTIDAANYVPVKRKGKGVSSEQIGNTLFSSIFYVLIPTFAFIFSLNSRFSLPVWVVTSALALSIFTLVVLISSVARIHARLNKRLPYLTQHEFLGLIAANFAAIIGYGLVCVGVEYGLKITWSADAGIFALLLILGLAPLTFAFLSLDFVWVHSQHKAGKYEVAIRRLSFLRQKLGYISLYLKETRVYRLSGKYDKAEKVLYAAIMQPRFYNDESASKLLEALARLRLEQERFAESLYFAEKAHELNPKATSHILLAAEVYLRARVKLDRVWQLLAIVQAKTELTKEDKIQDNYTEALAQALVGEYKWAQELLKRALTKADKSYKPGIAAIYFRAGQIADMQGDNEGAIEYYRRAQFADPFGTTGTKASRILRFSPTPAKEPVSLP